MASKMYEFLLAASSEVGGTYELQDGIAGLKNVKATLYDLVGRATEAGYVVLASQYRELGTDGEWVSFPAPSRGQQLAALDNRPPDVEDEGEGERRRVQRAQELRKAINTALAELAGLAAGSGTPDDGIVWEWRELEAGSTSFQRKRVDGSFGERAARSAMLLASLAEFAVAHPGAAVGLKGFYPMPR